MLVWDILRLNGERRVYNIKFSLNLYYAIKSGKSISMERL